MLKKKNVRMAVVAAALCGPWLLAGAQEPAKEEAAKPVKEAPAMEALEKMGAYLRTLKTFELSAYSTIDKVLPTGQNVQLDGTVKYTAEVPDKLLVDVNSDRKHRQYFYDGKTVTVYAPRMKYYAVFDAPPTIRETIEKAEAEYDIQLPLVDLFYWGTKEDSSADIVGAVDIGPSTINGEECEQFAYRQEGVDWQLWVRAGDKPLPCKLVITTTSEESQPQYSAVMSWNLEPKLDASTFTFKPAEDVHKIVIRKATEPSETATKQ
ncbi:MAG: DUF2092 domain-containing protein [Gammaproteobacteria bacterium]|nr:DUF2092 domain-containing protein [Gammaproteobacteria bacterium]MCP5424835.1 DUF2092 domain-containing protein [Gammaproteobacteria bacterium]MCP5458188.1 DUF2092 domain-containing protein [Gammaproteobacteria bacterium]